MGSIKLEPAVPQEEGSLVTADAGTPVSRSHPEVSLRARVVNALLWLTVRQAAAVMAYMPRIFYPWPAIDVLAGLVVFPEQGFTSELVRLPHCDGRWFHEDDEDADRAILYLHGGGFLAGGIHTHRRLATRIAQAAAASVLVVDYRMLPDHAVDDGVQDCVLGYRWLLGRGYSPAQISIVGDSAGGYFAFAAALRLREEGLTLPASLVGISPFTDWDIRTKVDHRNIRRDSVIPRPMFYYLERKIEEAQARNRVDGVVPPKIDLYEQSLDGFPPALLHVSTTEALLPDAQRLAEHLGRAQVPVTIKLWQGQPHAFQIMDFLIPEAKTAVAEIAEFVRNTTGEPPRQETDQEDIP